MAATPKTPATTRTSPTQTAAWTMAARCRQRNTNARKTPERGANREVKREGIWAQATKTTTMAKSSGEGLRNKTAGNRGSGRDDDAAGGQGPR